MEQRKVAVSRITEIFAETYGLFKIRYESLEALYSEYKELPYN